jgi:hypothetical protein
MFGAKGKNLYLCIRFRKGSTVEEAEQRSDL